jgi:hypothetical protein
MYWPFRPKVQLHVTLAAQLNIRSIPLRVMAVHKHRCKEGLWIFRGLLDLYHVTCAVQQDARIWSHPRTLLQKHNGILAGLQDEDA